MDSSPARGRAVARPAALLGLRSLSLIALLGTALCSHLLAAVPVREARQSIGSGNDRAELSLEYLGGCAERIGARIGYLGRRPLTQSLERALQYARDVAPLLAARCPAAETIVVSIRATGGLPTASSAGPLFYRFEMRRSTDWAPERLGTGRDLFAALEQAGYLVGAGPRPLKTPAFLRMQDGRFDAVYGRALENRMTATSVRAQTLEGADPPQISHYLVRGHWYELEPTAQMPACDSPRAGYPAWGSFTLSLYPALRQLRFQRSSCVEDIAEGPTQPGSFDALSRSTLRRWGFGTEALAKALSEQVAPFSSVTSDAASFRSKRVPLLATEKLQILPASEDFCDLGRVDVVYRVNSAARDGYFGGSYPATLARLLRRAFGKHCPAVGSARVANYSQGDSEPYDRFRLAFRPKEGTGASSGGYYRLSSHSKSESARSDDVWREGNAFGPACEGPFCKQPGGRYLNAIYRGDETAVRQMDQYYREAANQFMGRQQQRFAAAGPVVGALGSALKVDEVQLLRDVANKYLHSYAAYGEECFDSGALERRFEHVTPVVIETDEMGVTTQSGGDRFEATYKLNPEFFPLLDELGSYRGARRSDHPGNLPPKALAFRGIVQMKSDYACRSNEVKQFERNLRALTAAVLAKPGTLDIPPVLRPPKPEQTVSAPFPATIADAKPVKTRVARLDPVDLPKLAAPIRVSTRPSGRAVESAAPAVANAEQRLPKAPATQQERLVAMNAALQAVNARFEAESKALMQQMQDEAQAEPDPAARMTIMQRFQPRFEALQKRVQAEVQRIQSEYL